MTKREVLRLKRGAKIYINNILRPHFGLTLSLVRVKVEPVCLKSGRVRNVAFVYLSDSDVYFVEEICREWTYGLRPRRIKTVFGFGNG